jgi:hypothetical protein
MMHAHPRSDLSNFSGLSLTALPFGPTGGKFAVAGQ